MRQKNRTTQNPPGLVDVLDNFKEDILKSLNAVQIGEVRAFNASRQTVNVQVVIKQLVDEVDGVKRYQDYPLMLECPLMFLNGGGSHLTMPVQAGDSCIILFNDRDIDNWFIEGGVKAPNTKRKHDLSDALAIVGVRNLQNALTDYPSDAVRLQYDTANKVEIKTGTIETTTPLLKQTGNATVEGDATVTGGLAVGGNVTSQSGGTVTFDSPVSTTGDLSAGNGATGTFTTVTVVNGIVTGGS